VNSITRNCSPTQDSTGQGWWTQCARVCVCLCLCVYFYLCMCGCVCVRGC
jgi:hypothetical protein